MTKQSYRRNNHCVYLCDYHIVLPTKYRHKVITEEIWKYLYGKLIELTHHHPKLFIKEANHDKDHIHILISIPPQEKVSNVIRLIKSNTSRNIKSVFPILKKHYWGTDALWSGGYFVSTVGISTKTIQIYIAKQGKLDTGKTATLFD